MHTTIVFLALAIAPGDSPALMQPAGSSADFNAIAVASNEMNDVAELPSPLPPMADALPQVPPGAHFAGSPMPAGPVGPVGDAVYNEPAADGGCVPAAHGHFRLCGWHNYGPDALKRHLALWHLSTGDMYPYQPYFPVYHGNYYFRPYYWAHILRDQEISGRWQADPRAPYFCNLFEKVYMELGEPAPDHYEEVPPPHDPSLPSSHFGGL